MKFVKLTDDGSGDLNLTPILDCFTVLIAYLLVGGVVAAYSVLDTQLAKAPLGAATAATAASGESPSIELFFAADGTLFFRGALETRFPPVKLALGTADPQQSVDRALAAVAKEFSPETEAVVSGAQALNYGTFARHVGLVRKHFRTVSLRAP